MYCEKCCMLVNDGAKCPVCGSRRVREPRRDDGCFLCALQGMWGGMLEDVLKQNRIPYFYKKEIGAGISTQIGEQFEHYRFYVRYEDLEAAQDVKVSLFPENGVE